MYWVLIVVMIASIFGSWREMYRGQLSLKWGMVRMAALSFSAGVLAIGITMFSEGAWLFYLGMLPVLAMDLFKIGKIKPLPLPVR